MYVCVAALLTVSEEVRSRCSLKHRKSLLLSDVAMENFAMDAYSVYDTEPGCRWEFFIKQVWMACLQPHWIFFFFITFFLLLVDSHALLCVRLLRENQPWASPKVSEHSLAPPYSAMGQTSLRPRKSMSVDMGQPSQANAKKLLGTSGLMSSFSQSSSQTCCSFT